MKPETPHADVRVENHSSVFLFVPLSEAADDWIRNNLQDDAQFWGNALVVEHRYARDLAAGMIEHGLVVI
jgi:hypothetical protein